MLIQEGFTIKQKLEILSDAAKYDVACTSSGVDRKNRKGTLGDAHACGLCHSFSADGRCISLLKILFTNECIYDCKYCVNRISNDTVRTSFTPEEVCTLTMEFYRRNYIEGLFLSSGILRSPDYTMEQICRTLWLLREEYHFWGYIHVKVIPGADPELIARAGSLADRMSINLELPTGDSLRKLAPGKSREKILTPMRQIQNGIHENRQLLAERRKQKKVYFPSAPGEKSAGGIPAEGRRSCGGAPAVRSSGQYADQSKFVPAGQSTQMIIGATAETDYQILNVTETLYRNFELKRVFFSAYTALNDDAALPAPGTRPPLLREHRLYQADWLLRFYGFTADELLTEERPYFNQELDPKCDWALRHLELFPVEVNRADYMTLLRVPGIGTTSVRRILAARKTAQLDFPDLKKFGVVLKRAAYFITCKGKMMRPVKLEEETLTALLAVDERKRTRQIAEPEGYHQMSLFEDFHLAPGADAVE